MISSIFLLPDFVNYNYGNLNGMLYILAFVIRSTELKFSEPKTITPNKHLYILQIIIPQDISHLCMSGNNMTKSKSLYWQRVSSPCGRSPQDRMRDKPCVQEKCVKIFEERRINKIIRSYVLKIFSIYFFSILKPLTSAGFKIIPLRIDLFFSLFIWLLPFANIAFAMIGDIVYEPCLSLIVENCEISSLSMYFLSS